MGYEIPKEAIDIIDKVSKQEERKREKIKENSKRSENRLNEVVELGKKLLPIIDAWDREVKKRNINSIKIIKHALPDSYFSFEIAFESGFAFDSQMFFKPSWVTNKLHLTVNYRDKNIGKEGGSCHTDFKDFIDEWMKKFLIRVSDRMSE